MWLVRCCVPRQTRRRSWLLDRDSDQSVPQHRDPRSEIPVATRNSQLTTLSQKEVWLDGSISIISIIIVMDANDIKDAVTRTISAREKRRQKKSRCQTPPGKPAYDMKEYIQFIENQPLLKTNQSLRIENLEACHRDMVLREQYKKQLHSSSSSLDSTQPM